MRILLALTLIALLSVPAGAAVQIGNLSFATDFDTLMAQAQQSQKTVVIKFFTDW